MLKSYLRTRASGQPRQQSTSYTPDQVAALYQFPIIRNTTPDPTIAIIELGGGFSTTDITTYFSRLRLPTPNVTAVSIDGATNTPDPNADGEVMLDILVAAAAYSRSTGTAAQIKVFFAPNSIQGFADAIIAAANDPSRPVVCSISWGGPENFWSGNDIAIMEDAFTIAARAGMTVLAAAGDNGSGDGEQGKHVDYPASSPQVIGCGGTSMFASNGIIHSEIVWNDGGGQGSTGGGYSGVFNKPNWQRNRFSYNKRGVPDIAGCADPYTGYVVIVDGSTQVIGGTSAVAPLFSGLVAILSKAHNMRYGLCNGVLYNQPGSFRDITLGNNGAFSATTGWDPDTGLGVPIGIKLRP